MAEKEVIVDQAEAVTDSKLSNLLSWFNPFSRGIGMWAWIFQRLTGLFLVMYVFIHLGIIGTMLLDNFLGFQTGEFYNSVTAAMSSSFVEGMGFPKTIEHAISFAFFIDAGLIAALVYHGYNGIRVILFDLGIGIRRQKTIFWTLLILGIISYVLAIWLILSVPAIVLNSGV
jgi:succinate dehydrogenase / fumarate reductase cytochrome b subunit